MAKNKIGIFMITSQNFIPRFAIFENCRIWELFQGWPKLCFKDEQFA
jgi:hypothetical protein